MSGGDDRIPFDWRNAMVFSLLALICLVPFNFMPDAALQVAGHSVPIAWILFFPAGGALLVLSAIEFWRQRKVPGFILWTAGFSLTLLISSLWAVYWGIALSTTAGIIFRGLAVACTGYLIGQDTRSREFFVRGMAILGGVVAAAALCEVVAGRPFPFEKTLPVELFAKEFRGVAMGAIGQPLPLAVALNLCLPFALWECIRRKSVLNVIVLALILVGIVMTFRRSAYAVMVLCSMAIILSFGRRLLWPAVGAAVLLMVVGAVVPAINKHISTRFNLSRTIEEIKSGHRSNVYQTALTIVREKPLFGIGTRQYELTYARYARYQGAVNTPDNQFLRNLMENGLVGLMTLVGLLVYTLVVLFRSRSGNLPFFVSVAGFSLGLFVLDGLYWPAPAMLFFAIAGAGCGAANSTPTRVRD